MKRYNLIQARGGEFTFGTEGIAIEGEGRDVIEFNVKRGTVSIIVPAETPDGVVCDECWFNNHTCLDIELEDGTHITGWVRGGEAQLAAELPTRNASHTVHKVTSQRRHKKELVEHGRLPERVGGMD